MTYNKKINIGIVKKVAQALDDMNQKIVYVGGAIVSIYADDPAADDVRPTKDVDITLQMATFSDLTSVQEDLEKKGIHPAKDENIICRFQFEDVHIDVMSTKEIGWAPSDPWFEPGFKNSIIYELDKDLEINIFPVSYFLASKFSAFHDRGIDHRTSSDFEDIIYVIDNRLEIVNEIKSSNEDVRQFLTKEFKALLKEEMEENITCHLNPWTREERFKILKEKLKKMVR